MRRSGARTLTLLLAVTSSLIVGLGTPQAAVPASGEWIEIDRGGRSLRAWVATPEGEGPFPSIIVIHANRGLDDWTRSVADRLAANGYVAAAPDLLSGSAPNGGGTESFADRDAAREAIYALDEGRITDDLLSLADTLGDRPDSDGRLSVSGFCWGGSRTFLFATQRPGMSAAYVFYGTAPDDAAALGRIDVPVFGFYGGDDNRVNSTIEPTAATMGAAGKTYEPVIYPGAGHGFLARGESAGADDPNRTAMDRAWERWAGLLASR